MRWGAPMGSTGACCVDPWRGWSQLQLGSLLPPNTLVQYEP